jgi:hypothetical protein
MSLIFLNVSTALADPEFRVNDRNFLIRVLRMDLW